jgi:hypothetical protein
VVLGGERLHLSLQSLVLLGGLLLGRLHVGELGFEVLDMLLLSLAEGTLSGAILGLSSSLAGSEVVILLGAVTSLSGQVFVRGVVVGKVGLGVGLHGTVGDDAIGRRLLRLKGIMGGRSWGARKAGVVEVGKVEAGKIISLREAIKLFRRRGSIVIIRGCGVGVRRSKRRRRNSGKVLIWLRELVLV